MRIATSPSERCLMKAAEWNPEFSSIYRTNRAIGRPRKRWEDKLVEDETENFTESSSQINKNWINTAEDRGRWTLPEENYTMTSKERQENNARMRMRGNSQSRPARYVNGVRLSDEEVANITQFKSKKNDGWPSRTLLDRLTRNLCEERIKRRADKTCNKVHGLDQD